MRHWVLSLTRDGLSGIAQCTTMHTPSPLHCVITRSALCRGRQPWFPTPASQFFSQCLEEYPVMEQAEHHQLHGQVPKLHCCLCCPSGFQTLSKCALLCIVSQFFSDHPTASALLLVRAPAPLPPFGCILGVFNQEKQSCTGSVSL